MALVAGDEVVGAGGFGPFEEDVVVGIAIASSPSAGALGYRMVHLRRWVMRK